MRKAVLNIAFLLCAATTSVAQDFNAADSVQVYEEYFDVLPPAQVTARSRKKIKRYGRVILFYLRVSDLISTNVTIFQTVKDGL